MAEPTVKDIIRYSINGRKRSTALVPVESPLDREIRDLDNIIQLYSKYPFIPFFEGADATLSFYAKLRKLSPTDSAIIESLITFVLGGELTVEKKKASGFRRFEVAEDVTQQQWDSYVEFISSFIDGDELLEKMRSTYDSYKTWGNAFLEVVLTEVAGQRFVKFYAHDADRGRYLITLPGEDKLIGIAAEWTLQYLDKHPPRVLPVYPNLGEFEDGTIRTIIHLKNPSVTREWYGEPDSVGAVFFKYLEYQLGNYTVEGYGRRWIAEVFFETFEDDEDNISNKNFGKAIEDTFTQSGRNRKRVMHRNAHVDAKPTNIHEFNTKTDEKFHLAMSSIAENQILKVHNWNHLLLGVKIGGSLGNGTEFRDVYKRKWFSKIVPEQKIILAPYRSAISLAETWLGFDNPDNLVIGLGNLFTDMLEEVAETKKDIEDEVEDEDINNLEGDEDEEQDEE